MTKKLIWRLGKLPSPEEVRALVMDKLITKEEAREILFSEDNTKPRDVKSLEAEITFLKEVIEKLSKNRTEIVETIKYIERPYHSFQWYKPYEVWCGTFTIGDGNGIYNTASGAAAGFNSIQTF